MSNFAAEQDQRLKDLLREKGLWSVYWTSLKIPFSRWNIGLGCISAIVIFLLCFRTASAGALADQLQAMATIAFPLAVGQLGFLLAGFSFFATVADKSLLCRMADKQHEKSGLSYIKYNFLVFMRVFVEYLAFTFIAFAAIVLLSKGIGLREYLSDALDGWPKAKPIIATTAYALFNGAIVYLLMQLASFIYNIYHVVMTSIRWELQKHYESANQRGNHNAAESPADDARTQ